MKKICLAMLIFLAGSPIQGQIKQYIEIDTALIPKHPFFLIERKYTGEFGFDRLPTPAEPVGVSFTLTSLLADEKDWTIQVFYDDRAVQILGDTIFKWPVPHKEGDQYTGQFSFIPWMSGLHNIVLHGPMGKDYTHPMEIEDGLSFQWCFDEKGNLMLMDQYGWREPCTSINTFFFTQDSLILKPYLSLSKLDKFQYHVTVYPPPNAGDTSTICYRIKSNQNTPNNCHVSLDCDNVDIFSYPEAIDVMQFKDDSIEIKFDFMPRTDIAACQFTLRLFSCYEDKSKYYADQVIIAGFVFDTDGRLLFANDRDMGNVSHYFLNPDYGDTAKRKITRIIEYSSDGQLIDIKTEW